MPHRLDCRCQPSQQVLFVIGIEEVEAHTVQRHTALGGDVAFHRPRAGHFRVPGHSDRDHLRIDRAGTGHRKMEGVVPRIDVGVPGTSTLSVTVPFVQGTVAGSPERAGVEENAQLVAFVTSAESETEPPETASEVGVAAKFATVSLGGTPASAPRRPSH